jgi:pantoate--beta-alanine ligase
VVSVFVNPLQFGPAEDLDRYPRDLERDASLLQAMGVDVLFAPDEREMYPSGFQTHVEVEGLTQGLCGAHRPGHFRGVTTVVAKLFNIVRPHVAVFGEKDFQQLLVVRRMARDLDFDVEIVGVPTVRDADGLALSSRHAYLSPEERRAALAIPRALAAAREEFARGERRAAALLAAARAPLQAEAAMRVEYLALVDAETLGEISTVARPALLALAAWVGRTRLIDNCVLGKEPSESDANGQRRPFPDEAKCSEPKGGV